MKNPATLLKTRQVQIQKSGSEAYIIVNSTSYINLDSILSKLTMELTKVNILGNLMSDYGLPGENIARQIFSYMALSSLKQGRSVCKSWNNFITKDQKLWMNILRRKRPYFEFLTSKMLSNVCEDYLVEQEIWYDFFELAEKEEDFYWGKMYRIIDRIYGILVVAQKYNNSENELLPEKFKNDFVFQKGDLKYFYLNRLDSFFSCLADEVWSIWDSKKEKKKIEEIYESKAAELTPERDFDKLLNIEIEKQMYIGYEDEKIGYHQAGFLQRIKKELYYILKSRYCPRIAKLNTNTDAPLPIWHTYSFYLTKSALK